MPTCSEINNMTLRNLKYSLFVIVALSVGISFGQAAAKASAAEQAASVTEFEVNGLKVLVKRRPSAPTFSGGLFFRGGVKNTNEKNAGIESLTLRVATEAGKKYPRATLRRELARTASAVSGGGNYDFSAISFAGTLPNFDKVWDIFADVTVNPTFADEDITRVKEMMISGLREAETSPDGALDSTIEKVINAGHPYANDPNGSIATLSAITPADIKAYHKKMIETSRMLLVIVGDLDPETVKQKVTASFSKIPKGTYKDAPTKALDFSKPTLDVTQRAIQTNYVKGLFAAPSYDSPDYYAMRVAMTMLQSFVYQEVRVERQLSYAPNADMGSLAANSGFIYVTANDANQAVSVMLDQMNLLKTRDLREEYIESITGHFLTTHYESQERSGAQAAELAKYELTGAGWRKYFDFMDGIRAVRSADIRRVSNKYMQNIRFVVIGNPAAVNKAIFLPE